MKEAERLKAGAKQRIADETARAEREATDAANARVKEREDELAKAVEEIERARKGTW